MDWRERDKIVSYLKHSQHCTEVCIDAVIVSFIDCTCSERRYRAFPSLYGIYDIIFISQIQTSITILSFLLLMCLYPEAQRKAQEELDCLLGGERLPTFSDRRALPYVEALCTEVLRWRQPTPLGKIYSYANQGRVDLYVESITPFHNGRQPL